MITTGRVAVAAFAAAEMNFVAVAPARRSRNGRRDTDRVDLSDDITVLISSNPSASTVPAWPSAPSGSAIGPAEQLIAAAKAEHAAAAADMRLDIDVPALRAQEGEVADRRFRAGQDDDVGLRRDRFAGTNEDEIDARLHAERIEIVEIGDA